MYPFIPFISNSIIEQLNLDQDSLKWDSKVSEIINIKERRILFPKIENVVI
jgi:methionyl-tRNA synthetase